MVLSATQLLTRAWTSKGIKLCWRATIASWTLLGLWSCGGADPHVEDPIAVEFAVVATPYMGDPYNVADPSKFPSPDDTSTRFFTITNAAVWAMWWSDNAATGAPQPLAPVDFSRTTIAGIYQGMRPSGCYYLNIESVAQTSSKIIVRYRQSRVSGCTAAVIYRLVVLAIAQTGKPVEFIEEPMVFE